MPFPPPLPPFHTNSSVSFVISARAYPPLPEFRSDQENLKILQFSRIFLNEQYDEVLFILPINFLNILECLRNACGASEESRA